MPRFDEEEKYVEQGAKTTSKIAKFGLKRTGIKIPLKVKLIALLVFFLVVLVNVVTSSLSSAQSDNLLRLNAKGEGANTPVTKEERDMSLNDQEYAQEDTVKLLDIIAKYTEQDKNNLIGQVEKDCKKNDWDTELTTSNIRLAHLKEDGITESTNTLVRTFSLNEIVSLNELHYTTRSALLQDDPLKLINISETDENGIMRYKSIENEDADYLVAMPQRYGKVGTRFKVMFDNGQTITLLKAIDLENSYTIDKKGRELTTGGIFEFVCDTTQMKGNIYRKNDGLSLLGVNKITGLAEVESEFTSVSYNSVGSTDVRLLAAFSISMGNGQWTYKNGKLYTADGKVINERKYIKRLENDLKDFLKRGHFYELQYEKDTNGNIYVREEVTYKTHTEKQLVKHLVTVERKDGTILQRTRYIEEDVEVKEEIVKKYVTPLLVEKDKDAMAEDIFNLDPNAKYANSGDSENEETMITIREAIENVVEGTQAILFNITSDNAIILSGLCGEFEWPVPNYYENCITSYYGLRYHPIYGEIRKHHGIDIAAPTGNPVVSCETGEIIVATYNSSFGNYVEIDHGNGITSLYAHMSQLNVRKGQLVERGETIGLVGSTGDSTGPHCHFEIHIDGTDLDPLPYITGK